ncbi:hypothetical protein PR048_004026 [Dryococelus australis]|uniref:Immunoglobulin V-set domain-containing protein n=1 Tax=Dryococelus australis TaxID=614101 RepID=A0ABQ9I4B8_9NEOP|nr:hypothetical protein PR048_004026 [Dryococelus australis]
MRAAVMNVVARCAQVSWVRRRAGSGSEDELELLTVGAHTYSGDPRYSVRFQYPNNWRLRLDRARKKDEGVYECQISTHPPLVSTTHLHVNGLCLMFLSHVLSSACPCCY